MPFINPETSDQYREPFVEVDPPRRFGRYNDLLGAGVVKKVYIGFDQVEGPGYSLEPSRCYAFEKAQRLNPSYRGRGVRQLKTTRLGQVERMGNTLETHLAFDVSFMYGKHYMWNMLKLTKLSYFNVTQGDAHHLLADNTIHEVQKQAVTMCVNKSFEAIWTLNMLGSFKN
ncbi:hypothetical protein Tco_1483188 [Tanacetum coccineum]